MRYINQIFTSEQGEAWDNAHLLSRFEEHLERLPLEEEPKKKLHDFVRFQLVGERTRYSMTPDWAALDSFESRAQAYEEGAEALIGDLAEQVAPAAEAAGVVFDAIVTTTATGNLMPGLSYRIARRLGGRVRPDTPFFDLGNVGCTGSLKALNLVRSLDPSFRNVLVVAVEVPSTLADMKGTSFDLWQGNCTFGDGAAALWVSADPAQGESALALEDIRYQQRSDAGFNLIRWGYRSYYTFALENEKTFDQDVRQYVVGALTECEADWKDEPRWAIHPAGIALLVRISRKLGIPGEAIQPSVQAYRRRSNMSSASILHVLKEVGAETPVGSAVNMLTMGAGFNVIYGRARKVR